MSLKSSLRSRARGCASTTLRSCAELPRASRANALGLFLLLPVLATATLACSEDTPAGERPDGPKAEETDPSGSGKTDAGGTDEDDGEEDEMKPPSKADAGSKPTAPTGGKDASTDAGKPPSSNGNTDAGGQGTSDAGAKPSDAAAPTEEPDAGTGGGEPDPVDENDTTIPMTIPTPTNGAGEIRPSTTVLKNGKNGGKDVWDFENKKIGVNNTVDCEGSEGQLTVFELEDGVTVKNLIVAGGKPGGNGIVCKGNCTLDHVYWEDVCEDAATNSKDGATMMLNHVIALHASDKMFQHNAKAGAKTIIKNSYVADFGKLWRSCGDCTANGGPRHLEISNVRVDGIKSCVAGANQNYGDTVTVKNLFVKGGYDAAKDKPKICQVFIGVTDHNGESTKVNDGASQWNSSTCKLSTSDVKSY